MILEKPMKFLPEDAAKIDKARPTKAFYEGQRRAKRAEERAKNWEPDLSWVKDFIVK